MLIKPKKSLGQNYLIDNNILNLMADIGDIKNDDIVLEVGPGTGNLTEKLLLTHNLFVIELNNIVS